jgi:hypothetical protein
MKTLQLKKKRRAEKHDIAIQKKYEAKMSLVEQFITNVPTLFPDLMTSLEAINDIRTQPQYSIGQIVFTAITLHILKIDSRNEFNNKRDDIKFNKNFMRAFKFSPPHFDTVALVLKVIANEDLEKIKTEMLKILIERKIFYKYKILGEFHNVTVDGTGTLVINKANLKHYPNACFKESKNGQRTYFINVVEAKIICRNGLAISIGTEWIENPKEEYDKQDCEQKAASRLMDKIRKNFPRLSICLVADGLYPNNTIFTKCKLYGWEYIITLKDGNLKTVQKQIRGCVKTNDNCLEYEGMGLCDDKQTPMIFYYHWITDLIYDGHNLNYVELIRTTHDGEYIDKYAYITSFSPNWKTVKEIIENGRLRFKIENEGFNTQKNLGYGLSHKFSRTSMNATCNYYTIIQIAHMINQFFELREDVQSLIKGRETLKSLWSFIVSCFRIVDIIIPVADVVVKHQIRLVA